MSHGSAPPQQMRARLTQVTEARQGGVHPLRERGLSCKEAPAAIRHQGDNHWRHLENTSKCRGRSSDQTSKCHWFLFLAPWASNYVERNPAALYRFLSVQLLRCLPVDSKLFHWRGRLACCQLGFSEWAAQFCYSTGGTRATGEGPGPVNTKRNTNLHLEQSSWVTLSFPHHAVPWINSEYVWKSTKGKRNMGTALKNGRFWNRCFMFIALASKFQQVKGRWRKSCSLLGCNGSSWVSHTGLFLGLPNIGHLHRNSQLVSEQF